MSATRTRLEKELAEVDWPALRPLSQRDALVLVDRDLDLVEVATSVATDETERVSAWLEAGAVCKPTRDQLDTWENEEGRSFRMLIVQPYVLVQDAGVA